MKLLFFIRYILLAGTSLLTLICGPPGPPPVVPESHPFLAIKSVSNDRPEIGERVRITWEYNEDFNPGASRKLTNQLIQLASLTIGGDVFRDTRGCIPEEERWIGGESGDCLDSNERAVEFTFTGPVVFRLIAFANLAPSSEVMALQFVPPNQSFVVTLSHFADDNYPFVFGSKLNMEFERVFGIYEVRNGRGVEDGVIDQFRDDADLSHIFNIEYQTVEGETLHPRFFGTSTSTEENDKFGFIIGGNFPTLEQVFLDLPNSGPFRDTRTNADIVIFGGSLRHNGPKIGDVTAEKGGREMPVMGWANVSPLIIQIDVRTVELNPIRHAISNVRVCTPRQGLVLSALAPDIQSEPSSLGNNSVVVDLSRETRISNGNIKGAVTTSRRITTSEGRPLAPQATVDVTWEGIPIFPDDDIAGLSTTNISFDP